MRDTTQPQRELEATREQLRNLIERNGDAIVVVDDAGLVQFANPAAESLFRRPAAELVGSELGLPVVVGETTEIDIVGQNEDQAGVAEMRVMDTEWAGRHACLAVLRDITDRKRAELERQQLFKEQIARAQAEDALRERDEFLALASHELKTPAATLSATAQLLSRQLDRQGSLTPDQLRRGLERLQEQSQRMARLVANLLDVSRINAGKMAIQPQLIDVRKLVDDVTASCQLTTSQHTLLVRGPDALQAVLDPIRIEQVLTNLLDNAIKYSPHGGPIEVELAETEPGMVCVSVRDYGMGIPQDRRERLFERFYRAHPDSQVSGMGLGLFITQHLVELHGGAISVESPFGGGALFTVRLPIRAEQARPVLMCG
jgi:two-component system, OmpR family, sensor histidine kinase VicK